MLICPQCKKHITSGSFAGFTFGVGDNSALGVDVMKRIEQYGLSPYFDLWWHGDDFDDSQPFAKISAYLSYSASLQDGPPSAYGLAKDVQFCSTECLRAWLNMQVDEIEVTRLEQSRPQDGNGSKH